MKSKPPVLASAKSSRAISAAVVYAAIASIASPAALRWGVGLRAFALRSSDPAILERAATVFRPWTPDTVETTAS